VKKARKFKNKKLNKKKWKPKKIKKNTKMLIWKMKCTKNEIFDQVDEIEAELDELVGQYIQMRGGGQSKYDQHKGIKKEKKAMEKMAILGFRRKNLGRKLTEDEKTQRKIINEIKTHEPAWFKNFQLKAARFRRVTRQNRQLTRNQACNQPVTKLFFKCWNLAQKY